MPLQPPPGLPHPSQEECPTVHKYLFIWDNEIAATEVCSIARAAGYKHCTFQGLNIAVMWNVAKRKEPILYSKIYRIGVQPLIKIILQLTKDHPVHHVKTKCDSDWWTVIFTTNVDTSHLMLQPGHGVIGACGIRQHSRSQQ